MGNYRRHPFAGLSLLVLGVLGWILAPAIARADGRPPAGPMILSEVAMAGAMGDAGLPAVSTPKDRAALLEAIARVLEREGVPGVGLALVDRDGVRWAGGVGFADPKKRVLVRADTQFRVASITKSVVALGVMSLVEDGRLRLDAPLRDFAADVEYDNRWRDDQPVTLAHLLEHTAGFDDMRFNETFAPSQDIPLEVGLAKNPRSRTVRWRPGSRFAYANPGYTVAARGIEHATGQSFESFLEQRVLQPIGMPTARFRRTARFEDRLAVGYDGDRRLEFVPILHRPAGSLLASPAELGNLVRFWLTRGASASQAVVSEAGLGRMEHTGTLAYRQSDVSYGLGNYGDVGHRAKARGHDGGLPGFASSYRYFPELGVGYVMLLNATHSPRAYLEIRALLFAHLTAGRRIEPPAVADPPSDVLDAAVGHYQFASPRHAVLGFLEEALFGITIVRDVGGLRAQLLSGPSIDLVATTDGGFRLPHESGTSIRFDRDRDGEPVLLLGGTVFETQPRWLASGRLGLLAAASLLIMSAAVAMALFGLTTVVGRLWGRVPRAGETALRVWPGVCAVAFWAMPVLLTHASARMELGERTATTMGLCAVTIVFAAAAGTSLSRAVRSVRSAPDISRTLRAYHVVVGLAAYGMTLYLMSHGIIGLRTWAW